MRARKRFGQHFLADASVSARIAQRIDPQPDDCLLEVGPGRGALTEALYGLPRRYVAVEIDRDLAPALRVRFPELELVVADVLRFDFAELGEADRWRIAGNLPYNISTPLLVGLLSCPLPIRDMHFMLQKELAERVRACPGSKAWGRLSVLVQHRCAVELLFDVEPSSFVPPPRVRSTLVRLTPRADAPALRAPAGFDAVLRTAFSARRKRLHNALARLDVDWGAAGVDPGARPDQLSVDDFVRIANALDPAAIG